MKKSFVVFILLLLVACQNNVKSLDTHNLIVETNAIGPKHYLAKSIDDAIDSLPFKLTVPKELPNSFDQFQPIFITDWNDPDDGKDIAIELIAISKEDESIINIFARDFDMSLLNAFKNDGDKITLDNKQTAYYSPPNDSLVWQSSNITWVRNNISYSVGYTGKQLDADKVKQILVNLSNQMQ